MSEEEPKVFEEIEREEIIERDEDLKSKKTYSKEEIDEIVHEAIIDSCREMITYIKQYSNREAIPLGENITYDSLYDFIVTGK